MAVITCKTSHGKNTNVRQEKFIRSVCDSLEHLFHVALRRSICYGTHEVPGRDPHWQLQAKQSFP